MRIQLLFLCLMVQLSSEAQRPFVPNYDESKVIKASYPSALVDAKGQGIQDLKAWEKQKTQWLSLFAKEMYGPVPKTKLSLSHRLVSKTEVLQGKAWQYVWELTFAKKYQVRVLGVLPKSSSKVPVFLGLNFCGNHTSSTDPNIPLFEGYTVCHDPQHPKEALANSRGSWASRWPYEAIVNAGFGSITMACGDFEQDYPNGYQTGVRGLLAKELGLESKDWTAIGAWAWGLIQGMNFLEQCPEVDAKKVIVHGHSRLGKAALWAAANEPRFAAIISNESGEGGAALSRRNFGESLGRITSSFPHWFLPSYAQYDGKEMELPFDQHILLSLMAPRPLYVASAQEDLWADPRGEFLGAQMTEPVYQLYGKKGLAGMEFPAVNQPIGHWVRYHIREGKHDINAYDWTQYLNFAQAFFK